MKVYQRHMRRLGYCSHGVRQYFSQHGHDYSKFLEHGIDEEELLEKDPDNKLILDLIEVAHVVQ